MSFLDDEKVEIEIISEMLKDFRKRHKLNQVSLAALLGVAQSQISCWENKLWRPSDLRGKDIKERLLRHENDLE